MNARGNLLIVGGYGEVGRRSAAKLALGYLDWMIVAGRDARQGGAQAEAPRNGVRPQRLRINDPATLMALAVLPEQVIQRDPFSENLAARAWQVMSD